MIHYFLLDLAVAAAVTHLYQSLMLFSTCLVTMVIFLYVLMMMKWVMMMNAMPFYRHLSSECISCHHTYSYSFFSEDDDADRD